MLLGKDEWNEQDLEQATLILESRKPPMTSHPCHILDVLVLFLFLFLS
jgi:hypothetical protein